MQFSVQPIKSAEETRRLAALASAVWHEYFPCILSSEQIDYMVEQFQSYPALCRQMEEEGYRYYFLLCDGEIAGYTGIAPKDGKLFLSKLYLSKEFRGKGLASEAFAFLESFARENNLSSIYLTVNRHNAHAISVYEKKGFVTVREQAADIGGGFIMDDFVMEKALAGEANV